MSNTWPKPSESYDSYTLLNLRSYYVFFIFFVAFQILSLYIVKRNLIQTFKHAKSFAAKMLHIVSCLTFPSIYRDWDFKRSEDLDHYEQKWKEVKYEHKVMTIWHACVNVVLSLPMIYTCIKVIIHHRLLINSGYLPTSDEARSTKISVILVCSPVLLIILAYLEYRLLFIYYRGGHPWSRLLKEFPCEKQRNQDNVEANGYPQAKKSDGEFEMMIPNQTIEEENEEELKEIG